MNKTVISTDDYLRMMRSSAVYNVAIRTPFELAPRLSEAVGNHVFLKREDLQRTFSFKVRGAYNVMARLPSEVLRRGVVAASAGNHALGVSLAALILETEATIVVPKTTPPIRKDAILQNRAKLIVHGDNFDEAYALALQIAKEKGLFFVHPYDHPDVIAGQGTVGLEIADQSGYNLDAAFVAVGGGGLISGVGMALKQLCPGVKVIGVEPFESSAMYESLREGKRVRLEKVGSFADSVAVKQVGEETFRIAQEVVDEVVLVSNDAICAAIKDVFEDCRAMLEPAGALAYAGLSKYVERDGIAGKRLAAVACGANFNFDRLRFIAERARIGEKQEAIFAVHIPEKPGSFRRLCAAFGGRSFTEFNYRMGDPKMATVFVGVEWTPQDSPTELVQQLKVEGFEAFDLTEDEMAKNHLRHMVGGRCASANHERLFNIEFPERSGALLGVLEALADKWNISLFHYRNDGADTGKALAGIQTPPETAEEFDRFLAGLGLRCKEVTDRHCASLFL